MVPDRALCMEVLASENVPEHIVAHSSQVAEVAVKVATALNFRGQSIDVALLEAGALLHDISKMRTIELGGDHAALGGDRVEELGFPELSAIVARHVNLGEWDAFGPVTEVELVNYADKRVRHVEVVSLDDRFHDLVARYGSSEKRAEIIRNHWLTLKKVEEKIFRILETSPEYFAL